jgi:hypothetical protein
MSFLSCKWVCHAWVSFQGKWVCHAWVSFHASECVMHEFPFMAMECVMHEFNFMVRVSAWFTQFSLWVSHACVSFHGKCEKLSWWVSRAWGILHGKCVYMKLWMSFLLWYVNRDRVSFHGKFLSHFFSWLCIFSNILLPLYFDITRRIHHLRNTVHSSSLFIIIFKLNFYSYLDISVLYSFSVKFLIFTTVFLGCFDEPKPSVLRRVTYRRQSHPNGCSLRGTVSHLDIFKG